MRGLTAGATIEFLNVRTIRSLVTGRRRPGPDTIPDMNGVIGDHQHRAVQAALLRFDEVYDFGQGFIEGRTRSHAFEHLDLPLQKIGVIRQSAHVRPALPSSATSAGR